MQIAMFDVPTMSVAMPFSIQDLHLWDCGALLLVDDPTYHTVQNGVCVPTCGPQSLSCSFTPRFRVPTMTAALDEEPTEDPEERDGGLCNWISAKSFLG